MKINKWIPVVVLGLVAVVVAIGAVNIGSANAASAVSDETSTLLALKGDKDTRIGGLSKTYLAEALGITEDELDTAIQTAQSAAIDQALEQGLITQAQADELNDGSSPRLDRSLSTWLHNSEIDMEALLADALGISVGELEAAYQEAVYARIDQAVVDGKLTEEQASLAKGKYALKADAAFQASMSDAYKAAVQEAVANGVITQEQADLILADAAEKDSGIENGLESLFKFDRPSRHGGHGMQDDDTETPEAETTTEP